MVMQRRMPVPVWGWAEPKEEITVTLDRQTKVATANEAGKWIVRLDAMETGEPRKMTVKGKTESALISDILLGEVWICGGQSNMEWPLEGAKDAKVEIAAAKHPHLRLFQVGNDVTPDGSTDRLKPSALHKCIWQPCTPNSAARFSATAYFFGRQLHEDLQVPIGLIYNAVGATLIEAWISREMLQADPDAKFLVERWRRLVTYAESPQGNKELQEVLAEYDAKQKEARAKGGWFWRSDDYQEPRKQLRHPSTFFNGRVNPLIPYAIRGVIWYQGEGNWSMGYAYRTLFPLLIQDWRKRWGQGDFPFLFVQLPNFGPVGKTPGEQEGWAELRESQLMALRLPNTAMVVTIDIGEEQNIHPKNKQDVGKRLALAARATAYKEPIVYSGPIYRDMKVEGNFIRIRFDHLGGGLVSKDGELKQFAIAGEDKKFVWATAEIDGDTVVVRSDAVAHPLAVRYAWSSNPEGCNLYNKEGLPASPFRTDNYPGTTGRDYKSQLNNPYSFKLKKY